jgi:tetratricopeptide (TPR) repeat protein
MDKLQDYINKEKASGFSNSQIKAALKKAGYDQKTINGYIKKKTPKIVLGICTVLIIIIGARFMMTSSYEKGVEFFNNGEMQKAIGVFENEMQKNPFNSNIVISLGMAYSRAGDYEKATTQFDNAITLDPSNPRSYFLQAKILFAEQDYAGAIEKSEKALELNNEHFPSHLLIANSYYNLNRYKEALEHLNKADKAYYRINQTGQEVFNKDLFEANSNRLREKLLQLNSI